MRKLLMFMRKLLILMTSMDNNPRGRFVSLLLVKNGLFFESERAFESAYDLLDEFALAMDLLELLVTNPLDPAALPSIKDSTPDLANFCVISIEVPFDIFTKGLIVSLNSSE